MRRSYGTRKKSLNLIPVIKITGYKIDRAYGSFAAENLWVMDRVQNLRQVIGLKININI